MKRRNNANLKARRARSWLRGQERKKLRIANQLMAKRNNLKAGVTPWEKVCLARAAERAQDPEVQERGRQHEAAVRR